MNTIEINTIDEFHLRVKSTHKYHPIFRGESDIDYKLICKFGRHAKKNIKNDIITEKDSLAEFKRLALPHLSVEPQNEWEWLALAQHHGLPTRLLDWTTNPLVAAFFACQPPYLNDASIYVIDQFAIAQSDYALSPFEISEPCIYRPRHTNVRMTTQAGMFIVQNIPGQVFAHAKLERWIIKNNILIDLVTMLDVYGIDQKYLFPGLDSIAQHIYKYYIW